MNSDMNARFAVAWTRALAVGMLGLFVARDAKADAWNTNSPMATARDQHVAILLQDGKLLVAGGSGGGNTAEVYDPTAQGWTNTGRMNKARYQFTATLLTNGQVLVAGGQGGGNSAELYDPVAGTWTNTGAMNSARYQHTATLLSDGQVLVAGGNNGSWYLTNAEVFNPATGTWNATGSLHTGRCSHTATLLPDGKVLIAGGNSYNGGLTYLSSVEIYDPTTGQWVATNAMTVPRSAHTATLLANGQVLVAGGSTNSGGVVASAELYTPGTGKWTAASAMSTARQYHTATLLSNGQTLVVGGYGLAGSGPILASAELYDPAAGSWTATSNSLAGARYLHTATALLSGQVLVAGGYNSGALSSSELYVPSAAPAGTFFLTEAVILPDGALELGFTNTPGSVFTVSATTNLALPLSNWTMLTGVTEISPGRFQFIDAQATNGGQRFYRVHSP